MTTSDRTLIEFRVTLTDRYFRFDRAPDVYLGHLEHVTEQRAHGCGNFSAIVGTDLAKALARSTHAHLT